MEFVSDKDEAIQIILSSKIHTRKYAFPFSYEQILFTKIMIGWPRLYLPPYTESFFPLFYGIPVSKTFIYRQEFNQMLVKFSIKKCCLIIFSFCEESNA